MPLDNTGGVRTDADEAAGLLPAFNQDWTGHDAQVQSAAREALRRIGYNNDADSNEDADSIYVARALDYHLARSVAIVRSQSGIDQLVPTSRELPPGTESFSYDIYDAVGMAKVIASNPDDLPRVDVRTIQRSGRVVPLGVSYGYTRKDIRNAQRSGSGLPTRKADVARAAMAQLERNLKVRGNAAYGVYGLLSHPNVPSVAPTTGNWAAPATTAEQIVDDFMALVQAIYTQSKGNFTPARVGMPFQVRMAMLRKRMTGGQVTAMQFLQQALPNIQMVEVQELGGAGSGGTHAIVATTFDATHAAYESVMDFTQYPPQERNLELVVPCEAESAGVVLYQPLAVAKMEGL